MKFLKFFTDVKLSFITSLVLMVLFSSYGAGDYYVSIIFLILFIPCFYFDLNSYIKK